MPNFDDDDTIVRYPPGQRDQAATVARWLRAGADLEESPEASTIAVITGVDWRGVRDEPAPAGSATGSDEASGDEGGTATTDGGTGDEADDGGTATTESGPGTSRPSLTTTPTTADASSSTPTTADLSKNQC